jgi:O6-methylguanine-DNA--protein-cysteine methyltransferase
VRSDGTLAGYRWGAKRKLALLKLEGAQLGPTADLFH